MESIIIQQRLRPIRLAFLTSYEKPETILESVNYSTALWGGKYNPIVPVWRRFPTKEEKKRSIGLIKDFDPDFLINLLPFPVPEEIKAIDKKGIINRVDFVVKSRKGKLKFQKGISILPLLQHAWDQEAETIKGFSRSIIASVPQKSTIKKYWSFVFGNFPDGFVVNYADHFRRALKAKQIKCSLKSIKKLDLLDIISPIDFTSYLLSTFGRGGSFSSHIIYIGNPHNLKDLVEFWNMRAAGKEILFVPTKKYDLFEDNIKKIIRAGDYTINDRIRNSTDLQKGPSVKDKQFETICDWIKEISGYSLTRCSWLPHWGKEIDFAVKDIEPCRLEEGKTEEISLLNEGRLMPVKLISPSFLSKKRFKRYGQYSWAVELQLGGNFKKDYFFTIPNEKALEEFVQRGMGLGLRNESKIGKNGIVIFQNYVRETIQLFPLKTWDTFKALFKKFDLEIELSPAGIYAQEIINFMGGLGKCRIFKIKGVREVLKKLSWSKLPQNKSLRFGMTYGEIKGLIRSRKRDKFGVQNWDNKCYKNLVLFFGQSRPLKPEIVADYLFEKNILRGGLCLFCTNCRKKEWYHIGEFSEKFICKYCFQEQHIDNLERKEWHYKADGMFMIPNTGEGSLAVILSLWRLNHISSMRNLKYITSIDVNNKEFEIDFACMSIDSFDNTYNIVLGESRNFVEFSKKDFQKLAKVSLRFPQKPYLCFSTLKDEFSRIEKKEIRKLMNRGFLIIPLTRKELDPYDLFDRFDKAPYKHPVTLKEFSKNTIKLNIES